ncbi:MAG: FAD-dependent oxidoreductase, partial [Ignavibacteria bacterium]
RLIFGTASFIGKNEMEVETNEGKVIVLSSKNIFINTGARPFVPDIPGFKEVNHLTSETIMDLTKLPGSLIIIGGSYIGLEFGQMFRRFGCEVNIIERSGKIISREDEDVSDEMEKILKEDGIKIHTESEILWIKKATSWIQVKIKRGSKTKIVKGTHVLVASGVRPNTEDLKLSKAGIRADERGFIKVNSKLETNIKGVYALGDVKGGPAFTHISYDDYRIIFSNLIEKKNKSIKGRLVPYTVFTDPQLGRVGLSEKDCISKGVKYKKALLKMDHVARAIETGEIRGFMKVLIDPDSNRILGCAMLGMEGGEIMAMIEIAMMGKMDYTKLRDAIFSHPTLSESLNNLFSKFKKSIS